MGSIISNEGMIPTSVVSEMFQAVQGHSALARLADASPIPFNGSTEFVFDMDNEVDIIAENGAKSNGGGTATAVVIRPIKFEYGMRVSDEFDKGSEEHQLNVTERFIEGFARKLGRGIDIAGFHGVNPRTGQPSDVVGPNYFDNLVKNAVLYDASNPDASLNDALAKVTGDKNGMALSPAFAKAMAGMKANGVPLYPEFAFGRSPEDFYGMRSDVNSTVSYGDVAQAYVGDFRNAFKWGYGQDIELEVIRYGNPDNNAELGDLKGHNQVYLRCEAYVGWGILAPSFFAKITNEEESE